MGSKLADSPLASGAPTNLRLASLGTTNATLVKAGPSQLFTIEVYNVSAALRFLKFYNKATAPTVGTDTPVICLPIGVGLNRGVTFVNGCDFPLGLGYATTVLGTDADTSAITAGDLFGSITYF